MNDTISPELDATLEVGGASGAQLSFLATLLRDREVDDATRAWIGRRVEAGTFTARAASQAITHAKTCQRKVTVTQGAPTVVTEAGMYELDGRIYKVQESKQGGRLYAVVLTEDATGDTLLAARAAEGQAPVEKVRFDYAPGMMRTLRAEHRMTVERAEALSSWFTFCVRCGRHLQADASVAAGIGPVCRKKV